MSVVEEVGTGATPGEDEGVGGGDWDVDSVRGDHESDEHWELRRNFLLQNKGAYPKLRLLSLSQVFANHEFLGCRYPEETMDLVAELSRGIVEEYRAARAGRLQRTFVKASDAAERKSKGSRKRVASSSADTPTPPPGPNKVWVQQDWKMGGTLTTATPISPSYSSGVSNFLGSGGDSLERAMSQYGEDLRGLVLVEQGYLETEGDLQIINRSCSMSHKPISNIQYSTSADGVAICSLRLGSSFVAEGRGQTKEMAKLGAALKALTILRRLCYTIQVKAPIVSAVEVGKQEITGTDGPVGGEKSEKIGEQNNAPLSQDNVGSRLLRLMGWEQGQGLGKEGQGITNPISAGTASTATVVPRSRLGLGMEAEAGGLGGGGFGNSREFREGVKQFLQRQMWQCAQFDLQFTPEFTSEERATIHQIASELGLRSKSHGKGVSRFLVVSRKIELPALLKELITLGESPKYRVIPPSILLQKQEEEGTTSS